MKQTLRETVRIARERHVLPLLAALAVLAAAGIFVGGVLIASSGQDTQETAVNTRDLVEQIQKERIHNTLVSCEQTNREHTAIVTFITSSVPRDRRHDPRVAEYLDRAQRSFPVQDCAALVKRRVQNP